MMHQICRVLDATLKKPEYQGLKVVFYVSKEPNDVTNGIFLLGAFLCAFLGAAPEEAWQPFQGLDRRQCLPYRDATLWSGQKWVAPCACTEKSAMCASTGQVYQPRILPASFFHSAMPAPGQSTQAA